jgi:phospholipid transport system substrate-binding protein
MPIRRSVLVLVLMLAPALGGAAAPEDAVTAVRKTLGAALEIAGKSGTRDEKLVSLRAVARDILDTRAMGRRAIGDVLAAQRPEQQAEFFDLFDQLMVRAYLQKLLLFRSPRLGYGEPQTKGAAVIVGTKIITTTDDYQVDYEMRERDGRWVATDVIVEGISLTENYRAQFASLLRDRSFEELLDLMRRKTRPVGEEPM